MKGTMCKYNSGVQCDNYADPEQQKLCGKCGWHPTVEAMRKGKMTAEQFIRDVHAPATTHIITGAIIQNDEARAATIKLKRSPLGNFVLTMEGRNIVIPGKAVQAAMGNKQ